MFTACDNAVVLDLLETACWTGQSIFTAEWQNQPAAGVQDSINSPIAGSHFPIRIEDAHQKERERG